MKLYERLGEKGFHTSVVTTFAVDFDAYEAIALSRLRGSGCHNNLLIIDRGMLSHALSGASPLPRHAGRFYYVSPASASGVFHSKIFLQLGRKRGRVIIGSANATASGLAGNIEIASIIECSDAESPEQQIVAAIWQYLSRFLDRSDHGLDGQLSWAEQRTPWIRRAVGSENLLALPDKSHAGILATGGAIGILERFVAEIPADSVARLIVVSPYWDDDMAAVKELRASLKPRQTVLLVDAQRALFPASAISDMDNLCIVDVAAAADGRFVHAKLILAESKNADYVLFGSANCTIAALGRSGFRGINEECCVMRRVPTGVISDSLNLQKLIDETGFTDPSDLPVRQSIESLPLSELTERNPGEFQLYYDRLIWRPSTAFATVTGEIELLDSDLSVLPCAIHRALESPAGEIHANVHDLTQRPFFARILIEHGLASLPSIISVTDILRSELKETGNRTVDRIASQLEAETEEGLWLLDILERLENENVPEDNRGVTTMHRTVRPDTDEQQFQVVNYENFVAGRHLRRHGSDAPRSSLAGTEFSLIRAFLNRVISLPSDGVASRGDDDELGFNATTNLSEEVTDIEELPIVDLPGIKSGQISLIATTRRETRQKQNQVQIDKAVTRFIGHTRQVAEVRMLTSKDLLRLQALLRIIITAGLPCHDDGSEKSKGKFKTSIFQVLPWKGGDVTWPRLLGKVLFAVFGGPSPPIGRLAIDAFHDQIPDDYLEFWACCFWTIHARIQASRDQPVLGSQALLERVYQYSGLSKEDRQHPKVIQVMDKIGDRFACRLGLSHGDIMMSHESVT